MVNTFSTGRAEIDGLNEMLTCRRVFHVVFGALSLEVGLRRAGVAR